MSIAIFDDDNLDRAKSMAASLEGLETRVLIIHDGFHFDALGHKANPINDFDIIFFHVGNHDAYRNAGINAICALSYSGGGRADIPRSFSTADGFTEIEVTRIKSALGESDPNQLKARILSCWNSDCERYALRLLCEAWLLVNWSSRESRGCIDEVRNALKLKDCEPDLPADIPIYAPVTLENWCAPFGTTNVEAIAESMLNVKAKHAVLKFFGEFKDAPTFQHVEDLFLVLAKA